MINLDKLQIDQLIIGAFNYFNGRINTFNRARLFINWCDLRKTNDIALGQYDNPNCVTIYPNHIINFYSEYKASYIYFIFIQTIIHELYHADQCIDDVMYHTDQSYHDYIENSVQFKTNEFIYNNINDILNTFGTYLGKDNKNALLEITSNNIMNNKTTTLYQRQNYLDHLLSIICEMYEYKGHNGSCSIAVYISIIVEYFNEPKSTITISINGKYFTIKNHEYIARVDILNDFLYNAYYCYNVRFDHQILLQVNSNLKLLIDVNVYDLYNEVVK